MVGPASYWLVRMRGRSVFSQARSLECATASQQVASASLRFSFFESVSQLCQIASYLGLRPQSATRCESGDAEDGREGNRQRDVEGSREVSSRHQRGGGEGAHPGYHSGGAAGRRSAHSISRLSGASCTSGIR